MKIAIAFSPSTLLLDVGIPTIVFGETELFTFEDKQYDDWCKMDDTVILEDIFRRFNTYPEDDTVAQLYKSSSMPSLSVGMTVELGESGYLCTERGWVKV